MSDEAKAETRFDWRLNAILFVITVLSVFTAGRGLCVDAGIVAPEDAHPFSGWPFAVPLLLILLFHEFGHWLAARAHRVPASLPYFLPMPFVLFGTMGAVIAMPERIRSRNALLDIGAAGPLAGMVVAVPTMLIGLHLSEVRPQSTSGYLQEGQSILYWALKTIVFGRIPDGHDVYIHPTAFAAWGGFLVTMVNMLPWGQLDGGHIAYALFGERQNRFARWVRGIVLGLFLYNVVIYLLPVWWGTRAFDVIDTLNNTAFWLVWYFVITLVGHYGGPEHPPVEGRLTFGRALIGWGTLLMFVLLFMPTPLGVF